jgi:hypothetical protein
MKSILADILMIVAVVNFEHTSAAPSYGSQFLGHEYWNERCEMGYTAWIGYWNDYSNGQKEYKREDCSVSYCPCSSCLNKELQCSTFTGTTLYVYIPVPFNISNYLSLFNS